jgi:large subunit ribosomal protein L13
LGESVVIQKTFSTKPSKIKRKWHLVDAKGQVLGRLASKVAQILLGKHKPYYVPHLDTGDFVVVINASKIQVTRDKAKDKKYYRHSGYPGGLKVESFEELSERQPVEVVRRAVWGMVPKNRLGRQIMKKLRVYADDKHPHGDKISQPESKEKK